MLGELTFRGIKKIAPMFEDDLDEEGEASVNEREAYDIMLELHESNHYSNRLFKLLFTLGSVVFAAFRLLLVLDDYVRNDMNIIHEYLTHHQNHDPAYIFLLFYSELVQIFVLGLLAYIVYPWHTPTVDSVTKKFLSWSLMSSHPLFLFIPVCCAGNLILVWLFCSPLYDILLFVWLGILTPSYAFVVYYADAVMHQSYIEVLKLAPSQ